MPSAGSICRSVKLRTPELKMLLLGGHVASLPESTLRRRTLTSSAMGKVLTPLLDLLKALKSGRPNYDNVRDLCTGMERQSE